jgi:hypothetical protein
MASPGDVAPLPFVPACDAGGAATKKYYTGAAVAAILLLTVGLLGVQWYLWVNVSGLPTCLPGGWAGWLAIRCDPCCGRLHPVVWCAAKPWCGVKMHP